MEYIKLMESNSLKDWEMPPFGRHDKSEEQVGRKNIKKTGMRRVDGSCHKKKSRQ